MPKSDKTVDSGRILEDKIALLNEKDALIYIINAITNISGKADFRNHLSNALKETFKSNGVMIILFDPQYLLQNPVLLQFDLNKKLGDSPFGTASPETLLPANGIIAKVVSNDMPQVWTISELMKLNNRPDFITRFRENQMKKIVGLSLSDHLELKGVMFIFSDDLEAFGQDHLKILKKISGSVLSAFLHALKYEDLAQRDKQNTFLQGLAHNLLEAQNTAQFTRVLQHEFDKLYFLTDAAILLLKTENQKLTFTQLKTPLNDASYRYLLSNNNVPNEQDDFFFLVERLKGIQALSLHEMLKSAQSSAYLNQLSAAGVTNIIVAPLAHRSGSAGVILLFLKEEENLQRWLSLLDAVTCMLPPIIYNLENFELIKDQLNEIQQYQGKLEVENLYLQEEIQTTHNYSEIVGTSRHMKEVYSLVSQVANTNSTVLILGETGTGKELIARAIHNASFRKNHVMVKVNCAVLPANLIESELFGHEKGSFTDATERRIGKFELANNSTIFLDEIGELPIALQAKLLRALQEKEIERIGGKSTIKTDVRVIAATNKDLLREVQLGNFRSDLYFRLNVFPIMLPALRDRKEDIPLLANHFAEKYIKKVSAKNSRFTSKAMKQLIAYNWPGNVRELEHLIERSVLMSKGNVISQVYLPGIGNDGADHPLINTDVKTIDEVERAHILAVLKMVNGKVSGVGGAAEILKIPATTLSSKILRLKIKKGIS